MPEAYSEIHPLRIFESPISNPRRKEGEVGGRGEATPGRQLLVIPSSLSRVALDGNSMGRATEKKDISYPPSSLFGGERDTSPLSYRSRPFRSHPPLERPPVDSPRCVNNILVLKVLRAAGLLILFVSWNLKLSDKILFAVLLLNNVASSTSLFHSWYFIVCFSSLQIFSFDRQLRIIE